MQTIEVIRVQDIAGPVLCRPGLVAPPALPAVAPGQVWLIEMPADGALPAQIRDALEAVNVVVYDRALTDAVSRSLLLGNYAEPAAAQGDATAARCVRFARDGWSVARLVPAQLAPRERTRRVEDMVDELARVGVVGRLPASILAAGADGVSEQIEARLDDLASLVSSHPRDTSLAIVMEAFGEVAAATRMHAVAGNGMRDEA